MKQASFLTMLIIANLLWFGCTDDPQSNLEIVSITPEHGATNVNRSGAIQVEFSKSMDPASCESRFGLHIGELNQMPMMDNMDGDIPGQFHWNTDQTVMMFHPDSTLMDSTMYSICLEEGMMPGEHGTMGMMMRGMSGHGMEITGGIITHFKTE